MISRGYFLPYKGNFIKCMHQLLCHILKFIHISNSDTIIRHYMVVTKQNPSLHCTDVSFRCIDRQFNAAQKWMHLHCNYNYINNEINVLNMKWNCVKLNDAFKFETKVTVAPLIIESMIHSKWPIQSQTNQASLWMGHWIIDPIH